MLILRLAIRNILGAGLRSWLNVLVLSIAFVTIILTQGFNAGMYQQVSRSQTEAEYGGGQYWHVTYDPYDPFTLQEAHGPIPPQLQELVTTKMATPILVVQGTMYPHGRIRTVLLKGIAPEQKILAIPSHFLSGRRETTPALIGSRMAKSTGLGVGDYVTVRWRDKHGTFDAQDVEIVQVMRTSVQSIDVNQMWLPLERLQTMAGMDNEATLIILDRQVQTAEPVKDWPFQSLDALLKDLREMVRARTIARSFIYAILLSLAMLAIFDTQVLSIFKRRKEIGTFMALGMTRSKLIQLFTLEGLLHSILAAMISAVYGIPLLTYFAVKGWSLPDVADAYGYAIGERLYAAYSAALIVGTTIFVFIMTAIVSYLPSRKIAKLRPTEALRGKTA